MGTRTKLWFEKLRSGAVLDSSSRCCTMSPGRLLSFGGVSLGRAAAAPIESNRVLGSHGVNVSVARLTS